MKRLVLMLLMIFLASCEVTPEEVLPPALEVPVIEEVIVEDVVADEILVESGPSIALMGTNMPVGSFQLFKEFFGDELQWYSFFNIDRVLEYQRVYLFYDERIKQQLVEAGFEWPVLDSEEAVLVRINEFTEIVFVNFTDTRFRAEAVQLFLDNVESIQDEVVSLWSFSPIEDPKNAAVLAVPEICRLNERLFDSVRIGFPMSPNRLPNKGVVRVQVLFIDFPDFVGTRTQEQLDQFFYSYVGGIETFFEQQSLGRVEFEWFIEPGFVRIPRNLSTLNMTRANSSDLDPVLRQAIQIADANVDYSDIDMVIVFMNPDIPERLADVSPAWPLEGFGIQTNEKTIYNATFIAGDGVRIGYPTIAHEIGHLFGLIDLYNYNWLDNNPERDDERQFVFAGVFDFMNLAPPSSRYGDNRDMFGWQRWLLDWLTDEEIQCLNTAQSSESTHLLTPVAEEGDTRMLVIRLSNTQALVAEVRAQNKYCVLCSGGVYTYLVDTTIRNGNGALQLLRPEHSTMKLFQDAYLSLGQSITYNNVTIQFESQQRDQVVISVVIS
jgi:M6 family metalloprotease-like protein